MLFFQNGKILKKINIKKGTYFIKDTCTFKAKYNSKNKFRYFGFGLI